MKIGALRYNSDIFFPNASNEIHLQSWCSPQHSPEPVINPTRPKCFFIETWNLLRNFRYILYLFFGMYTYSTSRSINFILLFCFQIKHLEILSFFILIIKNSEIWKESVFTTKKSVQITFKHDLHGKMNDFCFWFGENGIKISMGHRYSLGREIWPPKF